MCLRCGTRWCTCGTATEARPRVYAFGPYDDWLREAIIALKYQSEWARYQHLGALLVPIVQSLGRVDALVPVPLHPRREAVRGYNQARLLANAVAERANIPVHDALVRELDTRQQVSLSAELRRTNMAGAFRTQANVEGRNLVLIDDVITTGATLLECARALRAAGAARVGAVTLAHG